MPRKSAEETFALLLRTQHSERVLRESLVRQRAEIDTGLHKRLLESQDARRRHMQQQRALLAAHRGAGSLVGQASAAELLHGAPLPACDRWGDIVWQGCAPLDGPLDRHDALAHRQRKTLPHAALVTAGSTSARVGPHGTIDVQLLASRLPVVAYRELVDELAATARGERRVSYGMAVHANVVVEPGEAGERDASAVQQDGARVWPPEALGDKERMRPLTEALERMLVHMRAHAGNRVPTPGLGTAGIDLYRRGCAEADALLTGKALADFRELGLCAFSRDPQLLARLQRRAILLAMTAQAQAGTAGQEELNALASQLLTLAMTLPRCA